MPLHFLLFSASIVDVYRDLVRENEVYFRISISIRNRRIVTFSSSLQSLGTGALGFPFIRLSSGFLGSQKSLSSETMVRSSVPIAILRMSLSMVSLPNPKFLSRLKIG